MSMQIWKKNVRADLSPRREPYWSTLGKGKQLGFRKIDQTTGTWIAKLYKPGERRTFALGDVTDEQDYEWAKEQAEDKFLSCSEGIVRGYTVEQACKDYVNDRRNLKSDACADDYDIRFKGSVYKHSIAKKLVDAVMAKDLEDFRDSAKGGKSTKNQKLVRLRAALRHAALKGKVPGSKMAEWSKCKEFESAGKSRDIYLDMAQRRALIERVPPAVAELIRAAATTGARPGEIARAKRKQYDPRTGIMTMIGKTGTRQCELSAAAKAIFDRASKNKLPEAPLFPNTAGRKWSGQGWAILVQDAVTELNLPKGTCVYSFRHCFITDQIVEGKWQTLEVALYVGTSVQMIQKHYGHLTKALTEKLSRVQMI